MQEKMRWAVLSLGCFSRNRYWGERDDSSYRAPLCTSTFVEIDNRRLVIDPPLYGPAMTAMLYNRTGLKPEMIDYVYITHYHSDHYMGLGCFPNARLFAAPGDWDHVKDILLSSGDKENLREAFPNGNELAERLLPAEKGFMNGISLIELPGHTLGLAGIQFDAPEGRVVAAGDAVMTEDFFSGRLGYYNSRDFDLSKKSMDILAGAADIIIPGHSNYFLSAAYDKA